MTRDGRQFVTSEGIWAEPSRLMDADPHANMTNVDGARHAQLRGVAHTGMGKGAACDALEVSVGLAQRAIESAIASAAVVDSVDFSRELVFQELGHAMAGVAPRRMFSASYRVLSAIVQTTRLPVLRHLPRSRALRRAVEDVRALTAEIAHTQGRPRPPYLQDILRAVEEGVYTARDLPMLMMAPFIAGLDTLAHTLAFVLYRLSIHPDWRARLRAEVDAALAARGELDTEALALCPELGYFVQEVMRIHPLSPAVLRLAKQPFVVEGYQVEEGERLMSPHSQAHLMHEVYPNPERFDPLRFHPDRAEHRGPSRYAPYGIGPHICLGAGTAEVLLRANTAVFLRGAELLPKDPRYVLRVSNTSGARPVGFSLRFGARCYPSVPEPSRGQERQQTASRAAGACTAAQGLGSGS
jgi:cytochrome P450